MSISQVTTPAYNIFMDISAGNVADGIKVSTPAKIFWISADNTANGSAVYLKLWNLPNGNITVGTTPPDLILQIGGSSETTFNFQNGLIFPAGLSAAVVTTPGTAGNSSPGSSVILTIAYE